MCALRGGFSAEKALVRAAPSRETLAPLLRLTHFEKGSENLSKETEALEKQCESAERALEHEHHKLNRLQNRALYLKTAQRKQRNKRLILKGVAIETIIPDTKPLSEVEFFSLVEQVYQLESVKEIIKTATAKYHNSEDGG